MTRSRLAWVLAGLTALLAVADTLVVSAFQPLLSETTIAFHGWPLINAAACGSAVLGAVVVSRYPRHLIGWLFTGIGTSNAVSMFCESYSVWALAEAGPGGPAVGRVTAVVAAMTGGPLAMTGLVAVFLLAPDGRLPSRRWRWVLGAAVTGLALYSMGLLTVPPENLAGQGDEQDVRGVTQLLIGVGFSITLVTVLAAVAAVLGRLHRATGEARLQQRCIAAAAAFLGVGVVTLAVVQGVNGGRATWVSAVPLQVAYVLLLVCLAVAVLRYRLFDVDVLLNRAFVLGTGTLFAAGAYVAVVVVVGGAVGEWAGSYLLSVAATVIVALAFQPLRRRLVHLADRLAYGPRAAPYDALAAFSRSIGSSPAPETLLPAVAEAAASAVSARSATVTVDVAAGAPQRADWPSGAGWREAGSRAGAEVEIPVTDRSGQLGRIAVRLAPGHTLRPAERRLLEDIADQAALALRNTRLEAELRAHVETLDRQTEELAASRRRLIEAGDVARRRLEAAIARDVLPTLERLHADLAAPATGAGPVPADGYVGRANEALDSLRELTRGIFPTLLTRSGLGPALSAHFARAGQPGALHVDPSVTGRRFPSRVEAAAYQCATDAAAGAVGDVHVSLVLLRHELHVEVRAFGTSAADQTALADRVEAVGGSLEIVRDPSGQTSCLRVRLPADGREPAQPATEPSAVAAAHSSVRRSGPKTPLGT